MDLLEKFEKGAENHTYQRVDSCYKVNIFVGYNENGNMSFVITEFGRVVSVSSSKLINVSLKKRADDKLALTFDLMDNGYKSMFLIFCSDIIDNCEHAGQDKAIANAIIRWKYWRELFGKKSSSILDKSTVKGLVGELIELRSFFLKNWDEKTAISSWMGPLLGHKDFEIADTWYEIKTVNENAVQVSITSLEQLESDTDGHLVIVRLEDTSPASELSINLNKAVLSIVNQIKDPEILDLFRKRLNNIGYEPLPEYDDIAFIHKGTERFAVTDSFPRIRRVQLDPAIGNANYTILLANISKYKEG